MKIVKVPGKNNQHKVRIYALSTCAWCKLTKKFLKAEGVEYEYVDVDLCDEKDHEEIARDIRKRGGSLNYPTIIIDDNVLITGFRREDIREALKI